MKPELILIDGGKNQLKFTRSIIKKSNHNDIKVISIAKGNNRIRATETIFSSNGVVEFDKYSKSYLLLQEMRNEAHRFAIFAQRKQKKNTIKKSKLDNVPGIGLVLKRRLLKEFKNIKTIKETKVEDLMTLKGINEKIAKEIKAALNP